MANKKIVTQEIFDATVPVTAVNEDWIRSLRLVRKAKAGDKDAQAELEKLEATFVFEFEN